MENSESLQVDLIDGNVADVNIVGDSDYSIKKISDAAAAENLEAPIQIVEGYSYEYKIDAPYSLRADGGIIHPSKVEPSAGRITPNTYVGTLLIEVVSDTGEKAGEMELEVLSKKTDYRTEYQYMLEDITEKCTDLLMQYTSPANQSFTVDHDKDPQTLYQRFAFLKSVLDSEEFAVAVHRIISNPTTAWKQNRGKRDIRSVRKLNRHVIRQLAGASNRTQLPPSHPLGIHMVSVPEKVITRGKVDSIDTSENRFIKYALETFKKLCGDFKLAAKEGVRLYKEAELLEEELEEILTHTIFHKISRPSTLSLNSPVLQRKEGYREVLRIWLMISLAARLTWEGGENVYAGGMRDVATLYEYWLLFRLTELLENLFSIKALKPENFIEETSDKLGLKLKQGKYLPLEGVFETESRKLYVQFSYNKTFSGDNDYPGGGSWTRSMRPDYTLSIWPFGITEKEANAQELIVHLHFDAKYKVKNLTELFGQQDEDLDQEKEQEQKGTYKRADLLKMHSYRDSIRRTAGAYVLYPGGDGVKGWRGFHEIVPGLGAFTIKPNRKNDGSTELRNFLKDVIHHFLNRTSQREKYSYHTYRTFKSKNNDQMNEPLPEPMGENRSLIPDETYVLIGFYKNQDQYDWIIKENLYNARAGSRRGSLRLSTGEAEAKFVLLHSNEELITDKILKVATIGPRIYSKKDLLKKSYPGKQDDNYYLVYELEPQPFDELKQRRWNIRELSGYKKGRGSALPFSVTLAELMNAAVPS